MLSACALAEDTADVLLRHVGFERIRQLFEEMGVPEAGRALAMAMSGQLSVDAQLPLTLLGKLARGVCRDLATELSALCLPALTVLMLRLAMGKGDGALSLLCRLACAAGLMERCAGMLGEAWEAVEGAAQATEAIAPVLAAALQLCGMQSRAALLTPLSALCAGGIARALLQICLPACALAAMAAVAGNLSVHFSLARLHGLLCRCTTWVVGMLLSGFIGLLSVEGRLCAARDLGAARTVGQALKNLVPIIGDALSGSGAALLDSAAAVRNTVGLAGLLLAVGACARPMLRLSVYAVSLRLSSAIIEPVADPGIAGMAWGLGRVAELLVAICGGAYLLLALLAGTCLGGTPGFG